MMLSRPFVWFALGSAGLFLTGCAGPWDLALGANSGDGWQERYQREFHQNYTLNPAGRVEVEGFNGSIEITGWEKNSVDVEATLYADTESRLNEIHVDVQPSSGAVIVRAVQPFDHHGNAGVRFVIRVPRRAELSNIRSSNGPIRVDGVAGAAHLRTSNGSVHADGVEGALDIQTSNGPVEVSHVSGDTYLHTSNGRIEADVSKGSFQATTSNGRIHVRLQDAAPQPVTLKTSNGGIDVEMSAPRDVRASTSNSPITVRIPHDAGANVSARASNSSITSDFEVTVHGQLTKHVLEGTIGRGGPRLDLTTSNGGIHLLSL